MAGRAMRGAYGLGRRKPAQNAGMALARGSPEEETMAHAIAPTRIISFFIGVFEHTFLVIVGFTLMVLGLGLGVTMIMLPAGIVIGLLGFAMVVTGLFVRIDRE
jgi:hypothetical protein